MNLTGEMIKIWIEMSGSKICYCENDLETKNVMMNSLSERQIVNEMRKSIHCDLNYQKWNVFCVLDEPLVCQKQNLPQNKNKWRITNLA